MTQERKDQVVIGMLLLAFVLTLVLGASLAEGQTPKEALKPVVLTAEEMKVVDLLRNNLQDRQNQVEQARVEYERAILAREEARVEVMQELSYRLQLKNAGELSNYDFNFLTKTFTPKKAQ